METSRRHFIVSSCGALALAASVNEGYTSESKTIKELMGRKEFKSAVEAYTYAYPLITMEFTRRVITNVAKPNGSKAPMGQIARVRSYPTASFRDVTAPNADTLYTFAFFDVSQEPYVLSLPEMSDRYALFPMLNGWTEVFEAPGKRTTGTGAQTYAITGPGWSGYLPEGVIEYKSSTAIVWLLGRIYCTGTPEDYAAVHKIQDQVTLVPLSAFGSEYTPESGEVDPSIDLETTVRDQVNALGLVEYFTLFCELLKNNPPSPADTPILEILAENGVVPGRSFDPAKLDADILEQVPSVAFSQMLSHLKSKDGSFVEINGWNYSPDTGNYGTDYLQRASITAVGLGANKPQDAVYPTSSKSTGGSMVRDYKGSEKYAIHFAKGQMPPVNAFWSISMYDADYFFVDNPLNRYSISARQELKENADGSVDIYIQNETPDPDKVANWLPAPKGKFLLMMRLYWPKEENPSILDGSWKIPATKRVGAAK